MPLCRRSPPPGALAGSVPQLLILAAAIAAAGGAAAQGGTAPAPPSRGEDELRPFVQQKILSLEVSGARRHRPELLLSSIETKKGRRLELAAIRADIRFLWSRFKIRAAFKVRASSDSPDAGVHLLLSVEEFASYRRIEFQGLRHFRDKQVRRLLEVDEGESPTELTGQHYARLLEERYRQDGYAFALVRVIPDERRDVLVLQVDEGPKVKVRSFEFVGNETYPGSAFFGVSWNLLGSAGVRSKPGFLPLFDPSYSRKKLDADLERVQTWYRERGFLDAIVTLRKLEFSKDRSDVDIVARVHEGRRYVVSGVDIEILPPAGSEKPRFGPEQLRPLLELRKGEFLRQENVDRDTRAIREFYGTRGYPDWQRYRTLRRENTMEVLDPELIVDPDAATVRFVYRVREGNPKQLRHIKISGNELTRDHVIRRDIRVHPGEELDEVELQRSLSRLRSRGYFGDPAVGDPGVRVRLQPVDGSENEVDLEVDVTEATTGRMLFGAGYSTNTGLFGSISYNKRNFDWTRPPTGINPLDWFGQLIRNEAFHGGGQRLNLELRPGTEITQINASFYEPDVFGRQYETIGMQLSGQRQIRFYDTYQTDTLGAAISFDRRFGTQWRLSAGIRDETVQVEDIQGDAPEIVWKAEGSTEVRSLISRLTWTEYDRFPRPTLGAQIEGYVEYAPEWIGGQTSFIKGGGEITAYLPVYEDSRRRRHVLRSRLRFDLGQGIDGTDELYLNERFNAGGQRSLRGFDFRGIGPTQFGHPTGGEARLLTGAEYIFPILSTRYQEKFEETDVLRGLFFVDAGMLGDSIRDEQFKDIRVSWGFGLRLLIPGIVAGEGLPVNFDFGWPLRREATDDTQVFQFSISFDT